MLNNCLFVTNFTFLIHMFICFVVIFLWCDEMFTFFDVFSFFYSFVICGIFLWVLRIVSKNIVALYIVETWKMFIVPRRCELNICKRFNINNTLKITKCGTFLFYASVIRASGSALFKLFASSCKNPAATGLAVLNDQLSQLHC